MFAVDIRRVFGGICGLLAGVGGAVAIAACGHQITLRGHVVSIAEMEYRLRPDHITGSGTLTIAVHNYGRQTHNFVVAEATATQTTQTSTSGVQTYTTTIAARAPDLPPGQGATLTVALRPGRYGLASTLNNDQGQGMQGSLTVTSK